jgi:hypothetical protein
MISVTKVLGSFHTLTLYKILNSLFFQAWRGVAELSCSVRVILVVLTYKSDFE